MVNDPQRELFDRFSIDAQQFPVESVAGAAANILANAIRQAYPTRIAAEQAFNELMEKTRALLLEQHYDGHGRKKGIFPYNQIIEVPTVDFRTKNRK